MYSAVCIFCITVIVYDINSKESYNHKNMIETAIMLQRNNNSSEELAVTSGIYVFASRH
jgi:hypothetical protein